MFALNGRDAIAETGTVPFFRSLAPGDEGADVLQLKQILLAAGDDPGPMTDLFTEQTQFALAQWQAQHNYPNATPATPAVGDRGAPAGHRLHARRRCLGRPDHRSAGAARPPPLSTGPPGPCRSHGPPVATSTPLVTPVLTIQSEDDVVSQGTAATFVISASPAPGQRHHREPELGRDGRQPGHRDAADVGGPARGRHLHAPSPCRPGSTPSSSRTRPSSCRSSPAPATRSASLVGADDDQEQQRPVAADLRAGRRSRRAAPPRSPSRPTRRRSRTPRSPCLSREARWPEPTTTLSIRCVTLQRREHLGHRDHRHSERQGDPTRQIRRGVPRPSSSYSVGAQGSAVVTISGSNAVPTVTLSSATTYLQKGEPYDVTISLNEALGTPLTIDLTYGGSAIAGTDYTVPGGNVVVPAGQTSLQLAIPTVTDNVVESDRTLTRLPGRQSGVPDRDAEQRVGDHDLVGGPRAHHLGQHRDGGPGRGRILRHHGQPAGGEEHLGELLGAGHGAARPGLRAPGRGGPAARPVSPRSPWCCNPCGQT